MNVQWYNLIVQILQTKITSPGGPSILGSLPGGNTGYVPEGDDRPESGSRIRLTFFFRVVSSCGPMHKQNLTTIEE